MELIDKATLTERIDKYLELSPDTAMHLEDCISGTTVIDAVEVVRCKDCKLRHSSEFCECRDEMAYCSDGERRESEGT